MSEPLPHRRDDTPMPPPTISPADAAEQRISDAILALRLRFEGWALSGGHHIGGAAFGAAASGVGDGIAKMADALVRLRQQKLGGAP